MAAKAPAKKAAPKKAAVKATKAKAKTKYTKAQQQAYTAASRAAIVKARGQANIQGVQNRRALAAARSKAKPGRSGKRLKPVSGKQAVIRNKVLASQAAGYARRTQVYTHQQAAYISGVATTTATRKAIARVLARKKLKPKVVAKKAAAPRKASPFAAVGARAGTAAAAKVSAKAPAAKTRKAAGVTPAVNHEWIAAGNDQGEENCVAVALANHLLLHAGHRVSYADICRLAYRDSIWKALVEIDHYATWVHVGLREYAVIDPKAAKPGDIVGFEVVVNGRKADHCGVLMPGNMVISWGEVIPLESEIDEAWEVTWTTSQ